MMKANKITVKFKVEVLSVDAVAGILMQALEQFQHEYLSGKLNADDGDSVKWTVKSKKVKI